jgi:hypothetical protein
MRELHAELAGQADAAEQIAERMGGGLTAGQV